MFGYKTSSYTHFGLYKVILTLFFFLFISGCLVRLSSGTKGKDALLVESETVPKLKKMHPLQREDFIKKVIEANGVEGRSELNSGNMPYLLLELLFVKKKVEIEELLNFEKQFFSSFQELSLGFRVRVLIELFQRALVLKNWEKANFYHRQLAILLKTSSVKPEISRYILDLLSLKLSFVESLVRGEEKNLSSLKLSNSGLSKPTLEHANLMVELNIDSYLLNLPLVYLPDFSSNMRHYIQYELCVRPLRKMLLQKKTMSKERDFRAWLGFIVELGVLHRIFRDPRVFDLFYPPEDISSPERLPLFFKRYQTFFTRSLGGAISDSVNKGSGDVHKPRGEIRERNHFFLFMEDLWDVSYLWESHGLFSKHFFLYASEGMHAWEEEILQLLHAFENAFAHDKQQERSLLEDLELYRKY